MLRGHLEEKLRHTTPDVKTRLHVQVFTFQEIIALLSRAQSPVCSMSFTGNATFSEKSQKH